MIEFVLMTLDDYTSLLSSKILVHNELPPLETKITNIEDTIQNTLDAWGAVQNNDTPDFEDVNLCARINVNSRLAQTQKRKDAKFDETIAD